MNDNYELEACPFCGGDGQIKVIVKPYKHGWVGCSECHVYINWNHDPMSAIAVWNKRVVLPIKEKAG